MAIISRCIWFPDIPGGMNQDEAMSGYEAYALSLYGTDRYGTWLPAFFEGWGWTQLSVLQSYMSVPFIWLFGFSRFTARLPMLLISLAGIFALYAFARNAFGKKTAIWILFIAAISPWHIMQSRWGLDCNPFPHLLMIAIFFMHKALTQRKSYVYASMLFFGLAMYGYGIAWFTVPPFLVLLALWILKKKLLTFKEVVTSAAIYIATALPIICVIVVNFFQIKGGVHAPWFTAQYFPGNGRKGDLFPYSDKNVWLWLSDSWSRLHGMIDLTWADYVFNAIPRFGTIYPFSAPILVVGLLYLLFFVQEKDNVNLSHIPKPKSKHATFSKASLVVKILVSLWLIIAVYYIGLIQPHQFITHAVINDKVRHFLAITGIGISVSFFWKKIMLAGSILMLACMFFFAREEYNTGSTVNSNAKEAATLRAASHIGKVLVLSWLLLAIYAALMQQHPNVNNSNILHYPVIIGIGMGISFFWKNIKLAGYVIVPAYMFFCAQFLQVYFTTQNQAISRDFNAGIGEALQVANTSGADVIYTPVWEILTLFHLKLDPLYFQNKATVVDKNGKTWLPYRDRYHGVAYERLPEPAQNIAIVVHNDRLPNINTDLYNVWHGEGFFSVLLPRSEADNQIITGGAE